MKLTMGILLRNLIQGNFVQIKLQLSADTALKCRATSRWVLYRCAPHHSMEDLDLTSRLAMSMQARQTHVMAAYKHCVMS